MKSIRLHRGVRALLACAILSAAAGAAQAADSMYAPPDVTMGSSGGASIISPEEAAGAYAGHETNISAKWGQFKVDDTGNLWCKAPGSSVWEPYNIWTAVVYGYDESYNWVAMTQRFVYPFSDNMESCGNQAVPKASSPRCKVTGQSQTVFRQANVSDFYDGTVAYQGEYKTAVPDGSGGTMCDAGFTNVTVSTTGVASYWTNPSTKVTSEYKLYWVK